MEFVRRAGLGAINWPMEGRGCVIVFCSKERIALLLRPATSSAGQSASTRAKEKFEP